jgi:hypothetical protein
MVFRRFLSLAALLTASIMLVLSLASSVAAAGRKDSGQYGAGLIVNVPFAERDVEQVVQDIVQNGIIRGTKEYAKDQYVSGAAAATSTRVFPEWTEGGKVFYKIRLKALDPWNFKDSSDVGTLAVRYVVQAQDNTHTVLHIDARFVEDFRHVSHPSNGSVEGAEYKDIHDHLEQIEVMKEQAAEARNAQQAAGKSPAPVLEDETAPVQPAATAPTSSTTSAAIAGDTAPVQSLGDRVKDLRHQVERLVKAPGAPLKSAPFHTASTLQSLPSGTEVLIVISTPYWLGVETHDGQHGWMLRDDLELLP